MGTTDIALASQALGLLRENSISSFDDGTNQSDIAKLYYSDFAQDVLTRHPWSFATKKRKLNQDTTAPLNEFKYSHIVPAEALRIWAVFDSDAVGAKPINDYDIQGPEGQRRIFSNHEKIYVDYTVYTDEGNWPGYFIHFAMYALAAHLAIPVTDDEAIFNRWQTVAYGPPSDNEKGGKFAVATNIDQQQKPGEIVADSPIIDARFS